ncbi:MAG: hypothetical protein M1484_01290 [Patescibacteria group bacterium]|nr:hypothetical protein [Patescibacteria group bacterium]MCL5431715.1 hypothetical protein [Patescibacteria group bacterium]
MTGKFLWDTIITVLAYITKLMTERPRFNNERRKVSLAQLYSVLAITAGVTMDVMVGILNIDFLRGMYFEATYPDLLIVGAVMVVAGAIGYAVASKPENR